MTVSTPDTSPILSESAPAAVYDVWGLLAPEGQEAPSREGDGKDHTVVLLKTQGLRVVFRSLGKGRALPTHKADGPITVQVLDGHIAFSAGEKVFSLHKGELLALRAGVPHSLRAEKRSAILITVAANSQV